MYRMFLGEDNKNCVGVVTLGAIYTEGSAPGMVGTE